jgi:hypothetical protein
MVMLRASGKAQEIAKRVLKNKGVKVPKNRSDIRTPPKDPYLYH